MNKTSLLTGLILFAGAATFAISPKIIPGYTIPITISWTIFVIGFLLLLHVIFSLRPQSKPSILVELSLGIPLIAMISFTTHPTLIPGTNIPPAISWTLFALAIVLVLKTIYTATFKINLSLPISNNMDATKEAEPHNPPSAVTEEKKQISASKNAKEEEIASASNSNTPLTSVQKTTFFRLFSLDNTGSSPSGPKDSWVIVPYNILDIKAQGYTVAALMHFITPYREGGKVVSFWKTGKSSAYVANGKPLNQGFMAFNQAEANQDSTLTTKADSLTKKKRYLFGSLSNPSTLVKYLAKDPLSPLKESLVNLLRPIFASMQKNGEDTSIILCIPPLPIPKIETNNEKEDISVGAWEIILENYFLCLQQILNSQFKDRIIQIFKGQYQNPCDYADNTSLATWIPNASQLANRKNLTTVNKIQSCVDCNELFGLKESKTTGALVVNKQETVPKQEEAKQLSVRSGAENRRVRFITEQGHVWTPDNRKTNDPIQFLKECSL